MNWFVNENTCFPPLASIYAFYRVHLATPSLFPITPPLSLSIVSILSIHPLSGHPSAAHPPPSYLSHAFTPRDNPLRPVPLCPPMSAIVSVYRVHIIVMTLRRYGDLRGGGGEEEEERKIAETCVRNCLRLDRCGFPQRIIIIRGIPAHGRDYLMKELLGGGGGGRWKR